MTKISDEERRKRDRERKAAIRAEEKAGEYLRKIGFGSNRVLREEYPTFVRWTWADRNGEWLKEAPLKLLIERGDIRELRRFDNCTVFGVRQ